MRALLLTDEGPQLRVDYPEPTVGPDEVLIRLRLAGICSTDLHLMAGYKGGYRGVLGHEFVGEVVAAPGDPAWVGRRVVGEINKGCGTCVLCRRGLGKHCRTRQSLGIINWDGAFADFLTMPLANLHPVPDELSDAQAVFTEPLAAALQLAEQIHLAPSQRVFVMGDGRLGLLVAQVLALTGCDLTVIGRHPSKLRLLHEWGIPKAWPSSPELLAELQANPADVVVEVTGSPAAFVQATQLVRPQGIIALKSTSAERLTDFDLSTLVVNEITVLGSRCGPFPPALALLASGRVQVEPLIHARFPLADGVVALRHAGQRGVLKVLLQP